MTSNLNKVKAEAEAHSRLEEYERRRMLNLITNLDIEAISEVLPAGNTLLSPTTSGVIWDYYHVTMVKSIVTNDGIRLFIELPIVTPQSTFNLFDIILFPTQIPETKNFTL